MDAAQETLSELECLSLLLLVLCPSDLSSLVEISRNVLFCKVAEMVVSELPTNGQFKQPYSSAEGIVPWACEAFLEVH